MSPLPTPSGARRVPLAAWCAAVLLTELLFGTRQPCWKVQSRLLTCCLKSALAQRSSAKKMCYTSNKVCHHSASRQKASFMLWARSTKRLNAIIAHDARRQSDLQKPQSDLRNRVIQVA